MTEEITRLGKVPEEIEAEIIEYLKTADDAPLPLSRLCDCVAAQVFPKPFREHELIALIKSGVLGASFEEIMELCRYLGERCEISPRYDFPMQIALFGLLDRGDKDEFLKRFCDEGGFELLDMQKYRDDFVKFSQKYNISS